jgi:hypothetical protein
VRREPSWAGRNSEAGVCGSLIGTPALVEAGVPVSLQGEGVYLQARDVVGDVAVVLQDLIVILVKGVLEVVQRVDDHVRLAAR